MRGASLGRHGVRWGREPVCLKDIRVLGVDEIAWHKGHQYLTLVYQLDAGCRRLLWVGQHRKKKTLEDFFDWFGPDRSASLQVVCSDLWKPYLTVVADRASQAVRVLDRFHSMKKLSEAIDKVRAGEACRLKSAPQDCARPAQQPDLSNQTLTVEVHSQNAGLPAHSPHCDWHIEDRCRSPARPLELLLWELLVNGSDATLDTEPVSCHHDFLKLSLVATRATRTNLGAARHAQYFPHDFRRYGPIEAMAPEF